MAKPVGWWTRGRLTLVSASVVIVAGLLTAGLLWPDQEEPAPRQREYQPFAACLLTDDKGLTGEEAKAVWAGMQQASLANLIKVQYLAVSGPQTSANALAYFNSLALQKCAMIIAVGAAPTGAMTAGMSRFPGIDYVIAGEPADGAPAPIVDLSQVSTIADKVEALITEAVDAAEN